MIPRRTFLSAAIAAPAAALATPLWAREPAVFAPNGVAINGTDPRAYATQGRPVPGSAAQAVMWQGAEWRFASPETRAAFEANPNAHAPAFGGYCAYAASRGYLAPTIPEAWVIHRGTLYLNANLRARDLFQRDLDGNIAKARANWPAILG